MATVKLTTEADADLDAIADTIAQDNLERALSFTFELQEACYDLADYPERFALLAGFENEGVRRRVFGNYLIIYRIRGKRVEVLRIVHGAMDYEHLFGEE